MTNAKNDFLPVLGFDGYEIDKNGNLKSLAKRLWNGFGYYWRAEKMLKPVISKNGYAVYDIKNNKFYAHRLVAKAFIPNPLNRKQVNHINGNKLDNRLENLEWVTNQENMKKAYKTGQVIAKQHFNEDNHQTKLSTETVLEIIKLKGSDTLTNIANKFNISISHCWAIQHRVARTKL